jgi:PAS domain S-box-containing protein
MLNQGFPFSLLADRPILRNAAQHLIMLLALLLAVPLFSNAETSLKDSLLTQLNTAEDSAKLQLLQELANIEDISPDERIDYLMQVKALAAELDDAVAQGFALYDLGHAYHAKGDFEQALKVSMESLALFNDIEKDQEAALVHTLIGTLYFYLENYPMAHNHFKLSLEIRQEAGDIEQIANGMTNMGNILAITGKFDEAMQYYKDALKYKEELNDYLGRSQLYNNIANIHFARDEMDKVLPYRLKALEMDRITGDQWQIALKTYNLAEYYMAAKQPQKAYPYIIESKTIAERLGDKGLIDDNIHFLAMYHELIGEDKIALEYQKKYVQSIKETFSAELSEKVSELQVKYDMATKEKEAQKIKYQLEVAHSQKVILIFSTIIGFLIAIFVYVLFYKKKQDSKLLEHKVQLRTNELNVKNEELKTNGMELLKAKEMAEESEEKFRTIFENAPVLIDAFDNNGKCLLWNKECEKTFGWTMEEINATENSLSLFYPDEEMREKMLNTVTSTPDKKFREWNPQTRDGKVLSILWANFKVSDGSIINIGYNVTQQRKAEKQIRKNLREKTTLLQELYHRTKNNMALISAMLSMKAARSSDENLKATFKEINNKIQAMSLVHNKLYKSHDLSTINLKEYIQDLITLLTSSYAASSRQISVTLDLQDADILMDSAVPLGLVINELVSNIFKHAFPAHQGGEFSIGVSQDASGAIHLTVDDTGVGFAPGFDPRRDGSIGLATAFSLVEDQLKGEMTVQSDGGVKWHIVVKDNPNKQRVHYE